MRAFDRQAMTTGACASTTSKRRVYRTGYDGREHTTRRDRCHGNVTRKAARVR